MFSPPARASCSRKESARAAALFHAGASGREPTPLDARTSWSPPAAAASQIRHWEDGETGVVRTIGTTSSSRTCWRAVEATRGGCAWLLVFTRASVADPVLRRAQERVLRAGACVLRSTPVADPVDEFALFWDRFDPADPRRRTQSLGASSTRADRRMPAPHSSGRRCMTRSARKKPRSRCTGRL
jgi:hypothetical protein